MLLDCVRCGLIDWDHGTDTLDYARCPHCGHRISTTIEEEE